MVCMFPTMAFASDLSGDKSKVTYYKNYTAVGDSICAGFTQADYNYKNGFQMNIENSPDFCYAKLTGQALGSNVYNLGKLGCDTTELLDILSNGNNQYYNVYRQYIGESDLITLEIGSNDLLMATMHSVLNCVGGDFANMSTDQVMEMAEPLMTGNVPGIVQSIEKVKGINLSQEQIDAIKETLSDKSLSVTLDSAYKIFCDNYPKIVEKIRSINPKAEFVILNYYNPYKNMNFQWGNISYNTGNVIQVPTTKMNEFTLNYSKNNGYRYVDISDTLTNIVDPHPSTAGHAQIAHHIVYSLLNTVTATAQKGGTITSAGENIVKYQGSMTFSIAADSGYKIGDVMVDGESIGPVSAYTFTDVTASHSITVNFLKDDFSNPVYYKTYSALGDSITAGYGLSDYRGDFSNPDDGYVAVAAKNLGVVQNYNLALPAYTTSDLLNVLTNPSNKYYTNFRSKIQSSDMVSVDIGSNDLMMTLLDMVLNCQGYDTANMTAEQRYAIIEPYMNGTTLDSINNSLENYISKNLTEAQKTSMLDVINTKNIDASFAKDYDKFIKNWDNIIKAIGEINPDATVAAVGYYNANPDLQFQYNGTTYYIGKVYQKYIDMMNTYISQKSNALHKYVYVYTTGVELNSSGSTATFDPHPTKAGHAEIAARLTLALLINIGQNSTKPVTSVSLNKTTDTLNVGQADTLTATVNPSDASNKNVIWSSSNTSVATVDSSGKVTAVSVGNTEIKVSTVDGNKTATCNVTVTALAVQVTSVSTVDGNKTAPSSINVVKDDTLGLPKTGYVIDTETLILAGLIMLLAGMSIIRFSKKES